LVALQRTLKAKNLIGTGFRYCCCSIKKFGLR
jgi:hypothetical protein